jgi:hypothetical protein
VCIVSLNKTTNRSADEKETWHTLHLDMLALFHIAPANANLARLHVKRIDRVHHERHIDANLLLHRAARVAHRLLNLAIGGGLDVIAYANQIINVPHVFWDLGNQAHIARSVALDGALLDLHSCK